MHALLQLLLVYSLLQCIVAHVLVSEVVSRDGMIEIASLNIGQPLYLDKPWTWSNLPQGLVGSAFIRTGTCDPMLAQTFEFTLHDRATVFIAYDDSVDSPPPWLDAWETTDERLMVEKEGKGEVEVRHLYKKEFEPGKIEFGRNGHQRMSPMNYNIIIWVWLIVSFHIVNCFLLFQMVVFNDLHTDDVAICELCDSVWRAICHPR